MKLSLTIAHVSQSLAEQAYAQLRDALMEGAFAPGEAIVVQKLAEQLGTSVMPVRDAVMRLAAEHALELESGRSARVPTLGGQRFLELCDVRMLLEGRAAELAASRATDVDLRAIARCHAQLRTSMRELDAERALRANREFHFAVYRAAHHELLAATIEQLWLQCGPYFRAVFANMTSPEGRRRRSARHHDHALAAIRARDPKRASAAIIGDIEESASWYRSAHPERKGTT
jgi:DNA-binding GntR family transcriptional regulator